ncbi:hypothetical protein [Chitinophaga filiformis]|uniref:DUF3945 domain-containing protein n=1 Tax=Chitinophaga filiformis TaxID=104663 RepID=A0ABY4HWP0_CHIFI|nr:hypothetical protein [Chitinophaga filiformis]UPK68020.1 hypothetical protein MYF79_24000 [Chitinophaga filiformis]
MEQTIERLDTVKAQVHDAGWGHQFDAEIDRRFAAGETRFKLMGEAPIEDRHKLTAELEFSLGGNSAYYNGMKTTLYKDGATTGVTQFFPYYDKITVTEAANLLVDQENPRAVYKHYYDDNSQRYGTWLQLDFNQKTENDNHVVKTFHDNYGFKPVAKLEEYAFVELSTPEKRREAVRIMEQGAEIIVTPVNNKEYDMVRVNANPERRGYAIRDMEGNFLTHQQFRTAEALEKKNAHQQMTVVNMVDNSNKQAKEAAGDNEKKNDTPRQSTGNKRPRQVKEGKNKHDKKVGR